MRVRRRFSKVYRASFCVGLLLVIYLMITSYEKNLYNQTWCIQKVETLPYVTGFPSLTHTVTLTCDGHFIGFVNKFAVLKMAILNPAKAEGRVGGERLNDVISQQEKMEYFRYFPGYFSIPCEKMPEYNFSGKDHIDMWMDSLRSYSQFPENPNIVEKPTLVVTRYDYANLYFQIADFYNAFIVTKVLGLDQKNVDVLLLDAHPQGAMDEVWDTLFNDVIRAGTIRHSTVYKMLLWAMPSSACPLHNHGDETVPDLSNFIEFMLHRHDLDPPKTLACDNLKILFVLRRDYVAHPRNPTGSLQRKIKNEKEVLEEIQNLLNNLKHVHGYVEGVQMHKIRFRDQLQLASHSDILVGMHGAGLAHTMFLPSHGALIEIFPEHTGTVSHFQGFAHFRSLHYLWYKNKVKETPDHYSTLNPSHIANLVKKMVDRMCPSSTDSV